MFETAPDVASVLSTDVCLFAGVLLLSRLLDPSRPLDRTLFSLTAGVFVITYAVWRWHDTLPPMAPTFESLWPHLFFLFEVPAIISLLMSMIILLRHIDRSTEADAAATRQEISGNWPAVDIFICTYNEPFDILEKAVVTALAIDYPIKTVWVLDDTRRAWLEAQCADLGARYVCRPDNAGAKAGNLNNGLRHTAALTNAPVILVLDADFVSYPNILRRTVAMLATPNVAVVQTPQFYYNADPIQHNLMVARSWVDDQRMFFDVIQPAKDAWGCAFCVGTSFVVRRELLNEIGGFPTEAITEDINLSYKLLAHGYETIWLNERLSAGLSAEGLPEFITQRARWCLGTIQVALLKTGPILGAGYTFTQRWHYLHAIMNWISKPFIVLLLLAPSIYWFAGIPAFEADYLSFLRYGLPALAVIYTYTFWISRARTLPFVAEVTDSISGFAIAFTLASAAIKPFGRPCKVTDKGGDRSQPKIRGNLAALFGCVAGLSAASIVWRLISPSAPGEISPDDLFNLIWAGVSMAISFVAFVVCFERARNDHMFERNDETVISVCGQTRSCILASISTSHACIEHIVGSVLVGGDRIDLAVPRIGWIPCDVIEATKKAAVVRLRATEEQRRQMIILLYASGTENVARTANIRGTLMGLLKRCSGAD